MSTNDVPGNNPSNHDELACGCWAEHKDGSLMFVNGNEDNRVVYSIFDMSKAPPIEYRDAMPEFNFKKAFSWKPGSSDTDKWTWHDKTPFPWDRLIKSGATDGGRFAMADHQLNAAQRLAESLKLHGAAVRDDIRHRSDQTVALSSTILDKIKRAVAELGK